MNQFYLQFFHIGAKNDCLTRINKLIILMVFPKTKALLTPEPTTFHRNQFTITIDY